MSESDPAAAAREHLLAVERETIAAVLDAADAVVSVDAGATGEAWFRLDDGRFATSDREALVPQLREELSNRRLLHELTGLLATAVDAAGYQLAARPVPAPPYVAMTSTGPVLRATVDAGRLVVAIDCFEVVRGVESTGENTVAYARTNRAPETALSVTFEPT